MKEVITAVLIVIISGVFRKKKQIGWKELLLCLVLAGAGLVWCLVVGFSGERIPVNAVERGNTGSGGKSVRFQVEVDQELEQSVTLRVPEVSLKREEAEAILREVCQNLDREILGENTSLEQVCYPLVLRDTYSDYAVAAAWRTNEPDYLAWDGSLGDSIPEEGAAVLLEAELVLQEYRETYQRQIRVFPSKAAADLSGRIVAETEKMNSAAEGHAYYLPSSIGDKKLQWYAISDHTGWLLLLLSLLLVVTMPWMQRQKRAEERVKRGEQLDQEYPELVSRMQMLLGAGLSMRRVFERIASEYRSFMESEKNASGMIFMNRKKTRNLACEEILVSCRELENGLTELEVYERFGNRCGTPYYRGLALLLEQNLTKGGQGLIMLLEEEALEAFENRQRKARQEGEKVSVRLLLPMGLMLLVVMTLIMVPAFMSM